MQQDKLICGDRQKDNIIRCLPYGVYFEKIMKGQTASKTRSIQASYHILKERGIFDNTILSKSGALKQSKRDLLEIKKIPQVLCDVCPDFLFAELPLDKSITVRGDEYHQNAFLRLVRNADAQNFLYSCGVNTPYTLLTGKKVDPFIFGRPSLEDDVDSAERVSLFDAITLAMCRVVEHRKYPSVLDQVPSCSAFFANRYSAVFKQVNVASKKNIERAFNNSIGFLVDFEHRCAYMIFCAIGKKELTWYPRAYINAMNAVSSVFRKLEIRNINGKTGSLDTAIILCETDADYKAVIRLSEKDELESCFSHVLPILMNEEGVCTIKEILRTGIKDYIASWDDYVSVASDIALEKVLDKFYDRSGTEYYNGTFVDICAINRIKKNQKYMGDAEHHTYLICCDEQKNFYHEVAGIPSDTIITV